MHYYQFLRMYQLYAHNKGGICICTLNIHAITETLHSYVNESIRGNELKQIFRKTFSTIKFDENTCFMRVLGGKIVWKKEPGKTLQLRKWKWARTVKAVYFFSRASLQEVRGSTQSCMSCSISAATHTESAAAHGWACRLEMAGVFTWHYSTELPVLETGSTLVQRWS